MGWVGFLALDCSDWIELGRIGLMLIGFDSLDWIGLLGLDWIGSDRTALDRIGCIGADWRGRLDRIGFVRLG